MARSTAFLLCTQHSNEIGAALMTLELAAELATSTDPELREILDNVVTVIIPTHNPDGHQMTVEWYRKWLDTPYEGQPCRGFTIATSATTITATGSCSLRPKRASTSALHNRERPQLVFDMHQMERDGARFMVPPFIDPLDPNQDPVIQQGFADLGTAIATRLTAAGKAASPPTSSSTTTRRRWPMATTTAALTCSPRPPVACLATPVTIEEDKLKNERGFDPKSRTWNHPMPWKGGEWTLRRSSNTTDSRRSRSLSTPPATDASGCATTLAVDAPDGRAERG